jgi:hypothetical protein
MPKIPKELTWDAIGFAIFVKQNSDLTIHACVRTSRRGAVIPIKSGCVTQIVNLFGYFKFNSG